MKKTFISGHRRSPLVEFHPPKSSHERREQDSDRDNPERCVGRAKLDIRPLHRKFSNRERDGGVAEAFGGDMHGPEGLRSMLGHAPSLLSAPN